MDQNYGLRCPQAAGCAGRPSELEYREDPRDRCCREETDIHSSIPLSVLLLVLPLTGRAEAGDGVHESITALCEHRWPEFPQQRHLCIHELWRAYGEVSSFLSTHCLDIGEQEILRRAGQGEEAAQRYADCADRWRTSYRALAACLNEPGLGPASSADCRRSDVDLVTGLSYASGCLAMSASAERYRRLLRSTDRGKALAALFRSEALGCLH